MKRMRLLSTAAAITFIGATSAYAADMPAPYLLPAPQPEFSSWYLRGDIGITNQRLKNLDYARFATAPGFEWLDKGSFDSAPLFGLGIGYNFNNWLRADITGEYRGKAAFRAMDRFVNGVTLNTNDYTGTKREWVVLANAYIDLGTWWCITPFVGAGVGFANVTIDNFRDINAIAGAGGYAGSASQTNFAWALHAGLAYQVTPAVTFELAYRYINLGDGKTGIFTNFTGTNIGEPVHFKDITSHDLKFGVRWALGDFGPRHAIYAPPPPAYAPPPPPPLMRKG